MFGFGGLSEILFIAFLAMLIFGPEKLPEIGRTLAKAMAEVRKASNELKRTLNSELAVVEQERNARRIQELDAAAAPLPYTPPPTMSMTPTMPTMPTAPPPDTQPIVPGGFVAGALAVPEPIASVEPAVAAAAPEPGAPEAAVGAAGAAPETASIPAHPAVAAEPAAQHALFPPYGEGHAPHHAPPADGEAP